MKKTTILLAACLLTWHAGVILAQSVLKPLPIQTLLAGRYFAERTPIRLSADGKWVAYTLATQSGRRGSITDPRHRFFTATGVPFEMVGSSVWVTNTNSGETIELIKSQGTSWGSSWSPDGKRLAFYSDAGGQAGLWLWDSTMKQVRQISQPIVRPFFGFEVPQWTPDGRMLLVKVLPEGQTIEQAAELQAAQRGQSGNPPGESPTPIVYSSLAGSDPGVGQKNVRWTPSMHFLFADLALINVADGSVKRIVRQCAADGYLISPDGSKVAYAEVNLTTPPKVGHDIVVVSLYGSSRRVLAGNITMRYGSSMSWSPDSTQLSYITSEPGVKHECFIISINGGTPRNLTANVSAGITDVAVAYVADHYRPPLWDAAGQTIYFLSHGILWSLPVGGGEPIQIGNALNREILEVVTQSGAGRLWSPNGSSSLYVVTRDRKTNQSGFFKINLATGRPTKLIEEPKVYGSFLDIDTATFGREIVYVAQDSQHYPDIWKLADEVGPPRPITHTNPEIDEYAMGEGAIIEWLSEDGEPLRGALLLPAGYQKGQRYPLVVEVYGGSTIQSDMVNRFGLTGELSVSNHQLLATRGYAIFLPDIPLSVGTPMRSIAKAVLPGVNKVIELGIADPDKLAVTGQSNGGYSTLALITQTRRFKAAIARSGFGNLISMYGVMGPAGAGMWEGYAEKGIGMMRGTPWDFRERYLENSPVFYLDRITTPLLLIHGTADDAVPPFLADEVFVGLRRLGKPVVYVKYQGEDHYEANFSHGNAVDYFNRVIAFLDEHLKNSSD